LLVDVVVGYAQDADGELSEDLGASLVVLALGRVIVDTTVELEDEALRGAVEVDDVAGDDLLAPELEAAERAVAEDLPGDRFDGSSRADTRRSTSPSSATVATSRRWSWCAGTGRRPARSRPCTT
jgi:hypothetical protein